MSMFSDCAEALRLIRLSKIVNSRIIDRYHMEGSRIKENKMKKSRITLNAGDTLEIVNGTSGNSYIAEAKEGAMSFRFVPKNDKPMRADHDAVYHCGVDMAEAPSRSVFTIVPPEQLTTNRSRVVEVQNCPTCKRVKRHLPVDTCEAQECACCRLRAKDASRGGVNWTN